jgi:hypothetical protein
MSKHQGIGARALRMSVFVMGLYLSACGPAPVEAPTEPAPEVPADAVGQTQSGLMEVRYITVFEHCNFEGQSWTIPVWANGVRTSYPLWRLNQLGIPDNAVSSIIVPSGVSIQMYDTAWMDGAQVGMGPGQYPCLVDKGFNDNMSSANVFASRPDQGARFRLRIGGEYGSQCLAVRNMSTAWDEKYTYHPCGGATQAFATQLGGQLSSYLIGNTDTGLCMNISGNSTGDRAPVIQWGERSASCGSGWWPNAPAGSYFWFVQQSDGTVSLVNPHSGRCIDFFEADTELPIRQWGCHWGGNQRFWIEPI